MCGWLSTSELILSLRSQPLLAVLRPASPLGAISAIEVLQNAGLRHIEIAWNDSPRWSRECLHLQHRFPDLLLGAASICTAGALEGVAEAGFRFAVSPILDSALLERAAALGITLVPGVLTPSEVHRAHQLGCSIVKLFPAASMGTGYWRQLAGPLGPLPFCIAAGGLAPADLPGWLAAGVDAVALGTSLFQPPALAGRPADGAATGHHRLEPALLPLLASLGGRDDPCLLEESPG